MKYKIESSPSIQYLEDRVNRMMLEGWRPIGGLVHGNSAVSQAMTLAEKKDEKEKDDEQTR